MWKYFHMKISVHFHPSLKHLHFQSWEWLEIVVPQKNKVLCCFHENKILRVDTVQKFHFQLKYLLANLLSLLKTNTCSPEELLPWYMNLFKITALYREGNRNNKNQYKLNFTISFFFLEDAKNSYWSQLFTTQHR